MKKLLFIAVIILVNLFAVSALAVSYNLEDIYFNKHTLAIDLGDNYSDFEWSCDYGSGTSRRPVARRYITFGHEYLTSIIASEYPNEYLDLYGFTTFANAFSDVPYTITIYDKTGKSKDFVLNSAPFALKLGVDGSYGRSPNVVVKEGQTLTVKLDSYNRIKKVEYCFVNYNDQKNRPFDKVAEIGDTVAYIVVPKMEKVSDLLLFIKAEDEYGNVCTLDANVRNEVIERSKGKIFFSLAKGIVSKKNASTIELFNPLTNKSGKYNVSKDVVIQYVDNKKADEPYLVIAKFNENDEIVSLDYQRLGFYSIYGLKAFNLSEEYNNLDDMSYGYLQNDKNSIVKFFPYDYNVQISKDAIFIVPTVKYNKGIINKITYKVSKKAPKDNCMVFYVTNNNKEAEWVVVVDQIKSSKFGKKVDRVDDSYDKFMSILPNNTYFSYEYNNTTHYYKRLGNILNEYDRIGGNALLTQFDVENNKDIDLQSVINLRSRFGYDFVINNQQITLYYNLNNKTYFIPLLIRNDQNLGRVDSKGFLDMITFIWMNEKKINFKVYSRPAGDNIELLADKISSLKLKNNIFKTKIGKITLKNCSILEDRIVFANKGVDFLIIPRERFVYQHYKVIDDFAKALGIEVWFGELYENSNVFKDVTLIYNNAYVYLETLYDSDPDLSATNGSVSQAELYDFVAYVLLNNKNVKFSK